MELGSVLNSIPDGLRLPLLKEHQSIVQNYFEHRWGPSELSGGKFCEIVYNILDGHAKNSYLSSPAKPPDFVGACRALEQNTHVIRSFQILIPRLLPALFEVRNNRGVGHAGGDVDSNHMDATFVVSSADWVMSELIRNFHNVSTQAAQALVDNLVERRIPLVWEGDNMRRVLVPKMKLPDQIIVLLATSVGQQKVSDLLNWTGYENRQYFMKLLRKLHNEFRFLELSSDEASLQILPPGSVEASKIVQRYAV
ncbi:MAG: hypothetical protein M3O03_10860 [Pseudomonadota bacterium]|nr:hypothetical protein [Pseudomonadota bacterium]